jgi:hypothetical protein
MLTKVDKKKQTKAGDKYVVLSVTTSELKDGKLYVWQDHIKPLFSELNMDAHRQIVVGVSQKTAANNQQHFAAKC